MSGILPGLECRHYRQWLGRPSSAKRLGVQKRSDTEDYVQRGPERTKEYTVRDEGGLPDVPKSTQASKHHMRPISALQFPARVLTTAQMYTPRLAY